MATEVEKAKCNQSLTLAEYTLEGFLTMIIGQWTNEQNKHFAQIRQISHFLQDVMIWVANLFMIELGNFVVWVRQMGVF